MSNDCDLSAGRPNVPRNQAILRFGGDDARTLAAIARLQADGVAYAGGARWRGQWVMRILP